MMLASSADDARRMYGSPARGNSLPRRTLEVTPSRTKCSFSRHSRRKLGDVTDYRPGRRLRTKGGERALSLGIWAGLGVAACAVSSALGNMSLAWIFVVVAPTGHTLFVQAQARRYNRIAAPGHLALTAGDAMTAQREFAEARAKVRWPGFLRRLGDYNRAFALIRQGEFAAAIELLSDLDQRGGVLNLDGAIAGAFALAHALAGNVELAEDWLAETRRRYGQYRASGVRVPAFAFALSEAAVQLRAGQAEIVSNRLANEWTQLENSVTGNILRPMRVLRAFALAQSSGPRDAALVDSLVAALRGTSTRDIDYLGAAWPEMHVFMSAHDLIQA